MKKILLKVFFSNKFYCVLEFQYEFQTLRILFFLEKNKNTEMNY